MKRIVTFSLRIAVFFLPLIVLLEILFRSLLPACSRPLASIDPETGLSFFEKAGPGEGLFTTGRYCNKGGYWRLNEHGYNSLFEYEYSRTPGIPRIAVIGDSYVLGLWIDQDEHLEVYLDSIMRPNTQVYNFGVWGSFLLSNIQTAVYVDSLYDPDAIVILVNQYDVTGSLRALGPPMYKNFQLSQNNCDFSIIPPEPYTGMKRRFYDFVRSVTNDRAILRYLVLNAKLNLFRMHGEAPFAPAAGTGSSAEDYDPQDPLLVSATEWMLNYLSVSIQGKTVLFVGDGPRYDGSMPEDLTYYIDCVLVDFACERYDNLHFLDLGPVFMENYSRDSLVFSPPGTLHWNAYANRIVAGAIYEALMSVSNLY